MVKEEETMQADSLLQMDILCNDKLVYTSQPVEESSNSDSGGFTSCEKSQPEKVNIVEKPVSELYSK